MGLITTIKTSLGNLFSGSEPKRIGIYGPPNAGKCLAADEEILLSDGSTRAIESVYRRARERCQNAADVSEEPHETWLECPSAEIRVPSLTKHQTVEITTVSHVFRQRYHGPLYRIRTEHGGSVTVSPSHPFVTLSENGLEQTKAENVSEGLPVACVSPSPRTTITSSSETKLSEAKIPDTGTVDRFTTDGGTVSSTAVHSVETIPYDGYIYDLTVPEHHTFVTTDGLVVHNTTLANRIARDWTGDAIGPESHVPHETRRARRKENVTIERNGSTVTIDIVDTPGVATKVDYKEFLDHDMNKEDAVRRSREATEGVAEAMHWLREDVDGVVYVLDSTADPFTQVNTMLVGIIESKNLPVLIFANKIDLDSSSVQRISNAFPQHDVVPLSALEGDNMDEVYDTIAEHFK